jgi:ubiquinone biosynthesis protein UbiJ
MNFIVTPAGLLDLATADQPHDLALTVTERSPLELLRKALGAAKPDVRIEGDVQLAAEVNWLVDHLRWDVEEDLSRIVGDAPAHALAEAARGATAALRSFVASRGPSRPPAAPGA